MEGNYLKQCNFRSYDIFKLFHASALTKKTFNLSLFPVCDIVCNGIKKNGTTIKDLSPPAKLTGEGILSYSAF